MKMKNILTLLMLIGAGSQVIAMEEEKTSIIKRYEDPRVITYTETKPNGDTREATFFKVYHEGGTAAHARVRVAGGMIERELLPRDHIYIYRELEYLYKKQQGLL